MLVADNIVSPLFPQAEPINLRISPQSLCVVVGPNGAGKSSLLRLLSGELISPRGSVMLHGKEINAWSSIERARCLAVLPQQSLLNFPFTVKEVVALGRTPHSSGQRVDEHIVAEVLRHMDASGLVDRIYTQLSGGEKQRVQIARVLAQVWRGVQGEAQLPAPLLLLDEPNSTLDLAHQQILLQALKSLAAQGAGVCVVVHDLNLAAAIADHIVLLDKGSIVAQGLVQSVLTAENIKKVFGVDMRVNARASGERPQFAMEM